MVNIDRMVRDFKDNGNFGKILIIDIIASSGEAISEIIYTLENEINGRLTVVGIKDTKENIHNKLLESIEYRVYAMSDRGMLASNDIEGLLNPSRILNNSDFYQFTFDIDRILSNADKYQTLGFFPTFYMSLDDFYNFENNIDKNFNKSRWIYEIKPVKIYSKTIEKDSKLKVYCGFYILNGVNTRVSVTPFIFWNDISNSELVNLIDNISIYLKDNVKSEIYSSILNILSSDNSYIQGTKLKLLCNIFAISLFNKYRKDIVVNF